MGSVRNRKFAIASLGVLAIVSCFYIWKADFFQKAVFPEDYWQKQADSLEKAIEFNELLIRSAYRAIQKAKATAALDIAENMDSAKMLGMTRGEARDAAVKEIEQDIAKNNELINDLNASNTRYRQNLEFAKRELARYQEVK